MEDSVFTKIIRGEIPCHRVYENADTIAFLDIHPVQAGHTLVVPKVQVDHLWDLSPSDYAAVMETTHKVALRLREVLHPKRVGMHLEGFDVPHAHVHLIPINDGFSDFNPAHAPQDPDHKALAELAVRLAF